MDKNEALAFIAALARGHGCKWTCCEGLKEADPYLCPGEADELMDEMKVSEDLRDLVVADVVVDHNLCDYCCHDGCERSTQRCLCTTGWSEKEHAAMDVWDQRVIRIQLIQDVAEAAIANAKGGA
jgi:hypothetical protein